MKFRIVSSHTGKLGVNWKRVYKLQIKKCFMWKTIEIEPNRKEIESYLKDFKAEPYIYIRPSRYF